MCFCSQDAWNIGQRKYKEYLAVHKMAKMIQKNNIACVELPLWELSQVIKKYLYIL